VTLRGRGPLVHAVTLAGGRSLVDAVALGRGRSLVDAMPRTTVERPRAGAAAARALALCHA
jgi:hypothetical protein